MPCYSHCRVRSSATLPFCYACYVRASQDSFCRRRVGGYRGATPVIAPAALAALLADEKSSPISLNVSLAK